jgi:hypothetical protein
VLDPASFVAGFVSALSFVYFVAQVVAAVRESRC